jgi:hypothetical protein
MYAQVSLEPLHRGSSRLRLRLRLRRKLQVLILQQGKNGICINLLYGYAYKKPENRKDV